MLYFPGEKNFVKKGNSSTKYFNLQHKTGHGSPWIDPYIRIFKPL